MSELVRVNGTGFVTGLGPGVPGSPLTPLPESVEAQGEAVLDNLAQLLASHGVPADGAVAATVYLTQFERFHDRLTRAIGARLPTGAGWVGVTALPRDALVQMDFVIRLD